MINDGEKWRSTLDLVKIIFPEAVIAGGCLRDYTLNSKEYNDVDIFVKMGPSYSDNCPETVPSLVKRLERIMGLEIKPVTGDDHICYQQGTKRLIRAYEFEYFGIIYQLIFLNHSDVNLISEFDLSINQISWDGNLSYVFDVTKEFLETLKTKIVKITRDHPSIYKRLDKFITRYPEFTHPYNIEGPKTDDLKL